MKTTRRITESIEPGAYPADRNAVLISKPAAYSPASLSTLQSATDMRRAFASYNEFPQWLARVSQLLLLVACTPALADSWTEEVMHSPNFVEIRISGMNRPEMTANKSGPYMVLACLNSTFSFAVNWREPVGRLGEKRRHLFYHVDGDSHLMLPVVDQAGESTGYENQSAKAQALVHEIFATVKLDFIPIGVFPAGRDSVTGEWIDAWFPTTSFKESVLSVGKRCEFDPRKLRPNSLHLDKISPVQPGS